jgi:hypothetical protein
LKISICDLTGKVVLSRDWKTVVGTNILPLDLSQVAKGTYVVNISSNSSAIAIKAIIQ